MARSKQFYIRKAHRYLGVLLGLQFLLWTVSGLYFSWTNIDEIHGDLQHKHPPDLVVARNLISPSVVFGSMDNKIVSIQEIKVINILEKPYYSISYFSGDSLISILADAKNGQIRDPIGKEEAIKIAAESFAGQPVIETVEYITSVDKNDEYREKPLPAWKIEFTHKGNTHVYVSAVLGKVETFRNRKWRTFDLLWMFHTMDYKGRDNFNNWVLRAFSLFGMITVMSGFALYFVSSKGFKKSGSEKMFSSR